MTLRSNGLLTNRPPLILEPRWCVLRITKLRLWSHLTRELLGEHHQIGVEVPPVARLVSFTNHINVFKNSTGKRCLCSRFNDMHPFQRLRLCSHRRIVFQNYVEAKVTNPLASSGTATLIKQHNSRVASAPDENWHEHRGDNPQHHQQVPHNLHHRHQEMEQTHPRASSHPSHQWPDTEFHQNQRSFQELHPLKAVFQQQTEQHGRRCSTNKGYTTFKRTFVQQHRTTFGQAQLPASFRKIGKPDMQHGPRPANTTQQIVRL